MNFLHKIIKIINKPLFTSQFAYYKLLISLSVLSLVFFILKSFEIFGDDSIEVHGLGFLFIIVILVNFPIYLNYIIVYLRNKNGEAHSTSDLLFFIISILLLAPTILFMISLF